MCHYIQTTIKKKKVRKGISHQSLILRFVSKFLFLLFRFGLIRVCEFIYWCWGVFHYIELDYTVEPADPYSSFYREGFVGQDHCNYVGHDVVLGQIILSIRREVDAAVKRIRGISESYLGNVYE